MNTTMHAVVFKGDGVLAKEQRPVPTIEKSDDVLLKVAAVGICGSDLHALHRPPTHPGKPGVVFGHEFCGEVVQTGTAVSDLKPGMFVAVDQNPPCGRCSACRDGDGNFCRALFDNDYLDYPWPDTPGFFWDGGMAEYVKVPAHFCYPMDSDAPVEHIVLAEPLGCALNGIAKGGVRIGDRCVILGGGPIGMLTLATLKKLGVDQTILVEPSEYRRNVATEVGAGSVIDPTSEDVSKVVRDLTGGRGASLVFEAVGSQLETALEIASERGRVVQVGINSAYRASVSSADITSKELVISGAFLMRYNMREALDLIASDTLPLELIVDQVMSLDNVHDGIAMAQSGQALKVVFKP